MLVAVWQLLFAWLPAWFQVVVLALIAIAVVLLVLKIVGIVLDAIPFL